MPTQLPYSLVQAYEETHYHVEAEPAFVLRVGSASVELRDMYARHGQFRAAYLTAWNPYSQPTDEAENIRRQASLRSELSLRRLPVYTGTGRDPTGEYPGEPSFLVLGLTLEEGRTLAGKYEQNAFLWCGEDAIPRLVLMR